MKPSQFILTFFVAAMFETICVTGFEWEPIADVENPDSEFDAVHPPNALRRIQATMDLPGTELESDGSTTGASASAASTTNDTEAPTTIMVLLPDNLAQSYSGSGSVMFFDGAVGDKDKDNSKSAGSDSVNDEASNAASVEMASAVTAFMILFALVMA
ncbi:unnamed protein product [Peronospora effusa]|nr:unnamed protein product [Peronospora effusa]